MTVAIRLDADCRVVKPGSTPLHGGRGLLGVLATMRDMLPVLLYAQSLSASYGILCFSLRIGDSVG